MDLISCSFSFSFRGQIEYTRLFFFKWKGKRDREKYRIVGL